MKGEVQARPKTQQSPKTLLDKAVPLDDESEDETGFYLSPLRPDLSEKEIRRLWRAAHD